MLNLKTTNILMKQRIYCGNITCLLLLAILLCSCATPRQITYFQDLHDGVNKTITNSKIVRVKPEDKISIIVKSKDPQLAELFNLPIVSYRVGQGSTSALGSGSQQVTSYSVNSKGFIDFPVLGEIYVEGQTREEIASNIKKRLMDQNLIKDPVVTVEFDNLSYSVLGEVNRPGKFVIDRDRVTILDAISAAGDLTIYGKRDNITVLRHEYNKETVYTINLCSGNDMFESPAYYLQQNDVVYVEPNDARARQSTVNGNNVRSASFWLSLASLLTTIGVLVFK